MNDFVVWLIELFRQYNLAFLALLIILQTNGIPVGANFLVIASGAFAYLNGGNIITLGLEVWFFSVLGDTISYCIWRKAGPGVITKFPRMGSWLERGGARLEGYFTRFGSATVFFTRFPFSALGPLVNITAGFSAYRYVVYLGWVILGESLWSAFNLGIGFWFGDSFEQVVPLVTQFSQLILLFAAIAGIVYWLFSKRRHKNLTKVNPVH